MRLFRYSLSKDYPEIFSTCKLPTQHLTVRYDGVVCCTTSIDHSGIVGLDLPGDAIEKIQLGTAKIVHWRQEVPPTHIGEDGKTHQITVIDVLSQ